MNPHQTYSTSLTEAAKSFVRNRQLITQFTKRDVIGKYKGSVMGIAWTFVTPLIMLAVYTFVFSVVFNARWGGHDGNRFEFAIVLYAGLLVHSFLCDCLIRSPGLVVGNPNYVKKVIFPLEIFSWVTVLSALVNFTIGLLVLCIAIILAFHGVPWTILLTPFVMLPLVFIALGVAWFLSASTVYFRDIGQVMPVVATLLMFLSPIFYPLSAVPEKLRSVVYLNPLAIVIEQFREVAIFGHAPPLTTLAVFTALSALFAWLGFWWFQKTRKGFADVL